LEAAKLRVKGLECTERNYFRSLNSYDPLSPEIDAAIKICLTANRPTLELLHKSAQLSDSRYPVDLSLGWNTVLPHLGQIKDLVQLLRIDIFEQSHVGNTAGAVRSLDTSFAVADSVRNEPLLISDAVRMKSVEIILNALERLLNERQLTHEQLIALSRKVAEAESEGRPALVAR
jgi:hypothetical protein